MNPLTETQIRSSFVNASRREVNQATLPDLATTPWDRLDYLGWTDERRPKVSYVVLDVAGILRGIVLSPAGSSTVRRKAMCAWCEDITATHNVRMFVARRAGPAGRKGDTVGTLICADFSCSHNVRRPPSISELGAAPSQEEREFWFSLRTEQLRHNATRFMESVMRDL